MECNSILSSIHAMPLVEGPIPITAESYPFCDMMHSRVPLDVTKYDYIEEEYFVSGKANIYDDEDGELKVFNSDINYKTRVIVRKPKSKEKFSGRVYFDILNATQNYDIEDLWHRIYLWCMENGHGYIGITSKPINVQSLKNFDYKRYASLDWGSSESVPQPAPFINGSIPGTEEGLIWDMLGQVAEYIRNGENVIFDGCKVEYLCLTGQSQSGSYINTFVQYFDKYVNGEDKKTFDSYLNIVGVPLGRELRQKELGMDKNMGKRGAVKSSVPFIMISSEGDLTLFKDRGSGILPTNCDDEYKCRYYEVSGSPHTDVDCPILSADSEIEKAGRIPQPMNDKIRETLNFFPLACYINGFLEKLYIWSTNGEAPDIIEPIERDSDGKLVRDKFGNAVGGFRSPYLDIPAGTYDGYSPVDGISGTFSKFSSEQMKDLYGSKAEYMKLFKDSLLMQIKDGFLYSGDAKRMYEDMDSRINDF